ncbi:MAG: amidohydrolase [Saprospiraceae bacterium]|nr:amidohydrolase [Saprospiraceae bacterium]
MRLTIALLATFWLASAPAQTTSWQIEVMNNLDQQAPHYQATAMQIWNYAELGYQETKSSSALQELLRAAGFQVTTGVADIPTAFVATFGQGQPVIGILAEFDALPGVSQTAVPFRQEREDNTAGHACGHHLFGTGSVAAGIAVKEYMERNGLQGTLRVYGTPAEEGGGGKVYMVRAGLFDDVDAVLHWHPGSRNSASAASSLSNKSAKFRFYGKPSHAAASPERGRSALDAVEAMDYMVNMMREHISSESRIHYVITRGGEAPNVVPEFAEVFYYCRHPDMAIVKQNFEWLVEAAEGAARGTQTRMDYEVIHGLYNLQPNETLAHVMYDNLTRVGGVTYDAEELAFAEKIQESFPNPPDPATAAVIDPFQVIERGSGGSTDVGDISWVVPTAGMSAATWVPGTSAHSWQAVACGGTSIGVKGMMVAAKTLALSAIDLFQDQETLKNAKDELHKRTGNAFHYTPLIGDRMPPLDYRNNK